MGLALGAAWSSTRKEMERSSAMSSRRKLSSTGTRLPAVGAQTRE